MTEFIEMAYKYDMDDESLTQYEDNMRDIIEKRLAEIKNLNSNDWRLFSDASYELFSAYRYLVEALSENGLAARAIKYSKEALEYSAFYSKYVDNKYMAKFSDVYLETLRKYKVEV